MAVIRNAYFKHIKIKYVIVIMLDDVEKPTLKQVGFFMSSFDSFANKFD
jgi:hypothetical protein